MKRIWYSEKFHCWFKLTGVKLYKSRIVPLTGEAEWKYLGDINRIKTTNTTEQRKSDVKVPSTLE